MKLKEKIQTFRVKPIKLKKLTDKPDGLITGMEYRHARYKILYVVMVFILIVACLTALIPIAWLFLAGFKDANEVFKAPFTFFPKSFDLGKVVEVWNTIGFGKYFVNTFIVMIGSVLCAVVFNGLLAYAVSIRSEERRVGKECRL